MTRTTITEQDQLTAHFVAEIRRVTKERNLPHKDLAVMAGMTDSQVSQILGGYNSPTLRTVGKLAAVLGIDVIFAPSRKSA